MTSFQEKVSGAWSKNNSLLCVGLDSEYSKLPQGLGPGISSLLSFNCNIVDATADLVCAYKLNAAFYAACNADVVIKESITYIKARYPHLLVILDSKRGDIGNTSQMYAREAFERYDADAVTVSPYLGTDSLEPFLSYKDKGTIVLCRTSNPGAKELQDLIVGERKLYQVVAKLAAERWNAQSNLALVVGATYPKELAEVREIVGDEIPLLLPGIGAQGGDVEAAVKAGRNRAGRGLIISSSRGIIYASSGADYPEAARREASKLVAQINAARA